MNAIVEQPKSRNLGVNTLIEPKTEQIHLTIPALVS